MSGASHSQNSKVAEYSQNPLLKYNLPLLNQKLDNNSSSMSNKAGIEKVDKKIGGTGLTSIYPFPQQMAYGKTPHPIMGKLPQVA